MKLYSLLSVLTVLLLPLIGSAKTLIVTHPQTFYDHRKVAGPGTRKLFEDESFDRKIMLFSSGELTFSTQDLNFETRTSYGGEFRPDFIDTDVTFAGGFWTSCIGQTIHDFVRKHPILPDMILRFRMDAIYMNIEPQNTMAQEVKENLTEVPYFIRNEIAGLTDFVPSRDFDGMRPVREDNPLTVEIYIRGRLIETWGKGKTRVSYVFE